MNAQQKQMIDGLADDFKESVDAIESGFKLTQNHYGKYMAFISRLAKNNLMGKIIGIALIQAGANAQGVRDALKALGMVG